MTARKTGRDPFEAIADPTRRGILESLRGGRTRTAGEIADAFAGISRPAVSRHLRVLRESGLVTATEVGREWHYQLNVAALARLQRDWFARFTPETDAALARLKSRVERAAPRKQRSSARRKRTA